MKFEPGDLGFTRGPGPLSRAIRFFERSWGEPPAEVNHVFGVVSPGDERSALILEALGRVELHTLGHAYGEADDLVEIWRPVNVTTEERQAIVSAALRQFGAGYGWGKLILHMLDWPFGRLRPFRRLAFVRRWPICSWVWAYAWAEAGLDFGMPAGAIQPDDMRRFCETNPDKWQLVRPLARLG